MGIDERYLALEAIQMKGAVESSDELAGQGVTALGAETGLTAGRAAISLARAIPLGALARGRLVGPAGGGVGARQGRSGGRGLRGTVGSEFGWGADSLSWAPISRVDGVGGRTGDGHVETRGAIMVRGHGDELTRTPRGGAVPSMSNRQVRIRGRGRRVVVYRAVFGSAPDALPRLTREGAGGRHQL